MALSMRMNLAGALAKNGDLAWGIDELKRAVGEMDAMGRGRTIGAATFHNNLAVLLFRAGDPMASLLEAEKAARIYGDPMTDPSFPVPLLATLTEQLLAIGRPQEATVLHERGQRLAAQRGDTRTAAYAAVGFNHCPAGQAARCDQRLAEARRALAAFAPPQHVSFGSLEMVVGELALARGELQAAHAALLRALVIFDAAPTPPPQRTRAAALLARTELALGHLDAATARVAQAVIQARVQAKGFAHSQWLGNALLAQGLVEQARGEATAAQASWREALAQLQATVGEMAPATAEARELLARR